MSALRLAAELLRRASRDDNYARDLDDAIDGDEALASALLREPLDEEDLAALGASELLWFAEWRQSRAGNLDRTLLDHLDVALALGSRFARYRLRGLPMRDPRALRLVSLLDPADRSLDDIGLNDVGLGWIAEHARSFRDPEEVARDALQYATPVSWFTLRILTSPDRPGWRQTTRELRDFAERNEVSADVTSLWSFDRFG